MNDERIDFSSIDPTQDREFADIAGAIARDAMAARVAAAAPRSDLVASLLSWMRPALVAAAIVLAIAIPALERIGRPTSVPPRPVSATEIMGIPRALTDLLHSSSAPTITELHDALAAGDAR